METNVKTQDLEIVQSNRGDSIVFHLKDPKNVCKAILSEIKQEMSNFSRDSLIIFPDQRIVESNQIFIENSGSVKNFV